LPLFIFNQLEGEMIKKEIENHPAWKQIASLSPMQRFRVLFGAGQKDIERKFSVTLTDQPYTALSTLREDQLAISVLDTARAGYFLAVLTPTKQNG
jgi:hypothetical protein